MLPVIPFFLFGAVCAATDIDGLELKQVAFMWISCLLCKKENTLKLLSRNKYLYENKISNHL